MAVRGRDAGTTLVLAVGSLVVVANVRTWGWPLIGGDRASIAALGLVGVAMYALSPGHAEPNDAVTTALGVLGVGAVFLVLAGVLIGTHVVLVLLLALLVAIWLVLTLRHLRRTTGAALESADGRRDSLGR